MKVTNINLPMGQLQHLLLGVNLVQDLLLQQHLQKELLVQDEEMLAD